MLRIDVNLLFTIINLIVLFIAMRVFLFKPVQKIIAQRQAEADRQFQEAADRMSEAENTRLRYEQSITEFDEKKKVILEEAKETANQEYHKILKDAKEAAAEVRREAMVEAEGQKAQILKKTEQEIAELIVDAAQKMIGGKTGAEVDHALYNKFLDKAGDEE